jgi:predicted nucleotidyltransferase
MLEARLPITIDYPRLAAFCRAHRIRRLRLFGSVLRDDFDPNRSDVDVLVELASDAHPGLAFFGYAQELSTLLGYPVDLLTPRMPSRYYRDEVLAEAVTVYDQETN